MTLINVHVQANEVLLLAYILPIFDEIRIILQLNNFA